MDLIQLNLELNKCKKRRQNLDNHLHKRQNLITYFECKKQINLNKLKLLWIAGIISLITSLSFFIINPFITTILFASSASFLTAGFYKLHVIKKFNKTIKKIEENNVKFISKLHELLKNELELDNQIKNLSYVADKDNKLISKNKTYETSNNSDLTI